jgi:uncharacterized protein YozE (UPF0346 family)
MADDKELELGATPFEDDALTAEEIALIDGSEPLSTETPEEESPQEESPQEEVSQEEEAPQEESPQEEDLQEEDLQEEKKKDLMIPKARLDQEIRNRRQAEEELKRYKQIEENRNLESIKEKETKEEETYISELESSFLNGDMRKVASILSNREERIKQEAISEMAKNVPTHVKYTKEQEDFEVVKESIEKAFPFLSPENENFDNDIVNTIISFSEAEIKKGKSPADALKDSTSKVLLYEKPHEVESFLVSQGLRKPNENKKTNNNSRLNEKVKASQSQPPEMQSSLSSSSAIPDFENMSDEEFDKLSAKEVDAYMNKMANE